MAKRGRKEIKPTVKMTIWVLAELFRDQMGDGGGRYSGRIGCERLDKHLRNSFKGGRVLPLDTIRRHYKDFAAARRKPDSKQMADFADQWLNAARANREVLGWDASVWLSVVDPAELIGRGYDVKLRETN